MSHMNELMGIEYAIRHVSDRLGGMTSGEIAQPDPVLEAPASPSGEETNGIALEKVGI